ncbi:hypothetical protein LZ198_16020 [Myxococcus sp. K15C18031901]|uniref:hypothetical protein n=1 Tax=Myxococcus dinghuensis TaxID=2906761 RepID=UPI0020A745F8|nr:hypothetical protein [Myxococcus dinghuensis]MCP3100376.1 hypothetical protein [Myxococcus dinghuensis]
MRNLTGVLVFSTTLLLGVGCHKNTGESSGPADASTLGADPQTDATKTAPSPTESPAPAPDASATPPGSGKVTPDDVAKTGSGQDGATDTRPRKDKDAGVDDATLQGCVDRWLKKHQLDAYGHPEGSMYAGGTPLFDERTGESKDRLTYVFEQHPEARKVCMTPPRPR